ncbi:uncharacterized protein LOC128855816 isoform X2 [Anastrepha ludens]|uniref:uncharacterized protein LOC128855816 isoform X2 n=1 Tax=Anastrepha ludens TaxID=28586 RepID=UPI0023B1AA68|nr:uncharacterized protein LOC128855816 isoform X2 [Anastrepha ludens]
MFGGDPPNRWTIMRLVNNFAEQGTVARRPYHRNPPVRTEETIAAVAAAIQRVSTRTLSAQRGVSRQSLQTIMHKDLDLFPYKIQMVNKLNAADLPIRLEFCQKILQMVEEDQNMLNCLFMSDEVHFDLNGNVNKQNCRIWSTSNPQILHETELHPLRVTVWCAVSSRCIVGPYFFEENGHTVTVTGDRYLKMLKEFFYPELRRKRIPFNSVWFQQDGATSHIAQTVMTELRRKFPNKLISRNSEFRWPPRSPDLTAPDFWGLCKQEVYKTKPTNLDELKQSIRATIAAIPVATLKAAMNNFLLRCRTCVDEHGGHLNSIIFKTS